MHRRRRQSDIDPGGMLLEDFGLWVDLVRCIREVLANYPEGTTALRDAGSSSRTPTMPGPRASASASTAAPMGPARCSPRAHIVFASNDAAFTEDEFASIPRIGGRKKSSQAWKTGSKMGASYTLYRCRALLRAAALSI